MKNQLIHFSTAFHSLINERNIWQNAEKREFSLETIRDKAREARDKLDEAVKELELDKRTAVVDRFLRRSFKKFFAKSKEEREQIIEKAGGADEFFNKIKSKILELLKKVKLTLTEEQEKEIDGLLEKYKEDLTKTIAERIKDARKGMKLRDIAKDSFGEMDYIVRLSEILPHDESEIADINEEIARTILLSFLVDLKKGQPFERGETTLTGGARFTCGTNSKGDYVVIGPFDTYIFDKDDVEAPAKRKSEIAAKKKKEEKKAK